MLMNIGLSGNTLDDLEKMTTADLQKRFRCPGRERRAMSTPLQWSISTGTFDGDTPVYRPDIEHDTTEWSPARGVVRLRCQGIWPIWGILRWMILHVGRRRPAAPPG